MASNSKTIIFDGKTAAQEILFDLKKKIMTMAKKPGIAVILVGDDRPSHIYVKNKEKASHFCGIRFHKYLMDENISETELLKCLNFLNEDPDVNAIVVQLPLPKKFNADKIIAAINPAKDADGFHPETLKKIKEGKSKIKSALIEAVEKILCHWGQKLPGKKAILVSNCNLFGAAFKDELQRLNIETEIVKTADKKLAEKTKKADILFAAVGKANFIKEEMVKEGAVVIDIGTSWIDKKFIGDVDFESVKKKASFIAPVPGGVGPMTVAMLLNNVYKLSVKK
ncbi:bifunctional 5,10-methylene-tetrahydrofolate dehydrogenase/5,10-methylene-tetrahydrofolate cyclohydrolase [Candidatus Parcubacteria bacterium]|nr:MAG: bifunctional 5,10-methylene-tetrahydrofolate dehydrogenase/5,10-methylene-tetrahydrofolate cyclohydrolase [Candidatus Parcubacteria bacterium]